MVDKKVAKVIHAFLVSWTILVLHEIGLSFASNLEQKKNQGGRSQLSPQPVLHNKPGEAFVPDGMLIKQCKSSLDWNIQTDGTIFQQLLSARVRPQRLSQLCAYFYRSYFFNLHP